MVLISGKLFPVIFPRHELLAWQLLRAMGYLSIVSAVRSIHPLGQHSAMSGIDYINVSRCSTSVWLAKSIGMIASVFANETKRVVSYEIVSFIGS